MLPTVDQIRDAAYYRWQDRQFSHGADRDDWIAAEQDLLFAGNYVLAVDMLLGAPAPQSSARGKRGACRFCERALFVAPEAPARHDVSGWRAASAFLRVEECDECHTTFEESLSVELESFIASCRGARLSGRPSRVTTAIPIGAMKGLARIALAIMPARDLSAFEETIEWVGNPDHDFDARLLRRLGCFVHGPTERRSQPWVALAKRIDADAVMPSTLFFLGTPDVVFEVPVPLGIQDDDLDGEDMVVPLAGAPYLACRARGTGTCEFFPMAPIASKRRLRVLV